MPSAFDELADALADLRATLRDEAARLVRPLLDWLTVREGLAIVVLVFLYAAFLAVWGWIAYRTGQPWWLAGAPVHLAVSVLLAARLNR